MTEKTINITQVAGLIMDVVREDKPSLQLLAEQHQRILSVLSHFEYQCISSGRKSGRQDAVDKLVEIMS